MTGPEAGSFDATGYRQRVLSKLRTAARLDLSDPFFIVDLPVDVDDEALIRARIVALVGFWNKERSPNYKALTAELAAHRGDLESVLLNPARRATAADRVRQARAAADADRYGALDALAERLIARYHGLPRSRMSGLASLARSKGLDDAAFAGWAAGQHIIEDGAGADPLPVSIRSQIRSDLDEFGRLTGDPDRSATLWAFLGVPPAAAAGQIATRQAELASQNDLRQHDHQMTVVANLLTYVKQHLISGDPARYTASLVEDAKDRLRDDVAEKVIVDGELNAADYEACVLRTLGFGFGLTAEQARNAVRQVATELGATLAVAPAVDYLVCQNCRQPQAAGRQPTCRYCGENLFLLCPSCAQRVERASRTCPHCGASLQLIRAVEDQIAAARSELAAGKPAAARARLADAERAVPGVPTLVHQVESLAAEISGAIDAAQSAWQAAERDLAEHRLYAAMSRISSLARSAMDVPSPAGDVAAGRFDDLAGQKAAVQAQLAQARGLPDEKKETAIAQVLAVAADCQEAIDMLAALPLAAPGNLLTDVKPDAIVLSWDPVAGLDPVSYKVGRLTTAPDGGHQGSQSLGTTAACEFEDAGVPGGVLVTYGITALSGRRSSVSAWTPVALMARDVISLRAEVNPAGVTLHWSLPISFGKVVVERTAGQDAPVKVTPRRDVASGSTWTDVRPTPGIEFVYHVFAEYTDARGRVIRTPGASVRATAMPLRRPNE